ncbi:hypothetical protein [Streptomyces sp. NBC_01508]|uniref:hypothetical protein n=1 Tax=Streptomyces sp. NBC_01508 TaxID=2903888 RepID=UPI003863DB63
MDVTELRLLIGTDEGYVRKVLGALGALGASGPAQRQPPGDHRRVSGGVGWRR